VDRRYLIVPLTLLSIAAWASRGTAVPAAVQPRYALTAEESAAGWKLLFDGTSMDAWLDPARLEPPGDAWSIEDGCLAAKPHPLISEDLVSKETYRDFELVFDWKIAKGGNSGVKYRIQEMPILANGGPLHGAKFEDQVDAAIADHATSRSIIKPGEKAQIYVVGFEYQLIDNGGHPDALRGPLYQSASVYSIFPPSRDVTRPVGQFNHSRLVLKGNHVEHWLNGEKVVDADLGSSQVKETLAKRWPKDSPVYNLLVNQPRKLCPISLQNHGDAVWFQAIKIRSL
jgi:Domain of Unknown Function (DUF1080)